MLKSAFADYLFAVSSTVILFCAVLSDCSAVVWSFQARVSRGLRIIRATTEVWDPKALLCHVTTNMLGVLFDLDNTLIDTRRANDVAYASVIELLRGKVGDPTGVIDLFKQQLSVESVDPNNVIGVDDWRTRLWAQSLQQCMSDDSLCKEVYHRWKETRLSNISVGLETIDLLRNLRTRYKIVLLTNGDSQVQWEKIRQCDIEKLFDAIVVSGDTEWEKPDARIFLYACQLIGVPCENAVMVGDSLKTDIQGALNADLLSSIWFRPIANGDAPADGLQATYEIQTLTQLADILTQLDKQTDKRTN